MASLTITIKSQPKKSDKLIVEMDKNRFERLASDLGFFSSEFLQSLERAEEDYRHGRIRSIKSLRELRKKK